MTPTDPTPAAPRPGPSAGDTSADPATAGATGEAGGGGPSRVDLPGLRRAVAILRHPNAGMVPPDGGDPSQTDRVRNVADDIADEIAAIDSRALAAPAGGLAGVEAAQVWRPMSEEPIGRPITARMRLGDGSWWYARVRVWRHEDGDGGRFGDHGYELLHYNGDVTMGRFYGPFDSWCEVNAVLDAARAAQAPRAEVAEVEALAQRMYAARPCRIWIPEPRPMRWDEVSPDVHKQFRTDAATVIAALSAGSGGGSGGAPRYVVWSNEHAAWWGPDECGYRSDLSHAGRYTREHALKLACARDGLSWRGHRLGNPPEIAIREDDALAMVADRSRLPAEPGARAPSGSTGEG